MLTSAHYKHWPTQAVILALLTSSLCITENHAACPSSACDCSQLTGQIDCASRQLDRVPEFQLDRYTHYTLLDLSHNQIYSVQPFAFQNLHLQGIDLSCNPLIGISPRAFLGGIEEELETLSLEGADLRVIHWGVFYKLLKLTDLNLARNGIFALPPELFQNLVALEKLDLSENSLTTITNSLQKLENLLELNLRGNKLKSIEDESFESFSNLERLDLSANALSMLTSNTFSGLNHIKEINLSFNNLKAVPISSFKYITSVQTLYLDHNYISEIDEHALSTLPRLNSLSVAGNNLTHVSPTALEGLQHLASLDLSGNQLTTLGSQCKMAGTDLLISLRLSNNPLDCTCRLSWSQHMVAKGAAVMGACATPPSYRGLPLATINFTLCDETQCGY